MSDNIIQLNQELIHNELKDLVRNSVEETLNALLDHEAEQLVNAEKYERSGERKGYRSGHYSRNFQTTSGDVTLKVPKLNKKAYEHIETWRTRKPESKEAARKKAKQVAQKLREMKLASAAKKAEDGIEETLTYMDFPTCIFRPVCTACTVF